MERAPELTVIGLDSGYKLLGEFNGVFLVGREQFITWNWDHTSLSDGHYHMEDYTAAKQDFSIRSGAIMQEQIFTSDQLTEVYRSIHETLDSGYPLTDTRRLLLEEAAHQIEEAVSDLNQRVFQSNQQELEQAQKLEDDAEDQQGNPLS